MSCYHSKLIFYLLAFLYAAPRQCFSSSTPENSLTSVPHKPLLMSVLHGLSTVEEIQSSLSNMLLFTAEDTQIVIHISHGSSIPLQTPVFVKSKRVHVNSERGVTEHATGTTKKTSTNSFIIFCRSFFFLNNAYVLLNIFKQELFYVSTCRIMHMPRNS
jgi:hypothetical protein